MTIFEFIEQYWLTIGLLSGIIANWIGVKLAISKLQQMDEDQDRRISHLEAQADKREELLVQIQKDIVEVKTQLVLLISKLK